MRAISSLTSMPSGVLTAIASTRAQLAVLRALIAVSACVGKAAAAQTYQQVDARSTHSCAVLTSGGVQCWGEVIIGQKGAAAQARSAIKSTLADPSRSRAKALTVDSASGLWTRAAAGIAEAPCVVEAGNSTTISAAITEINRVLRWVPEPSPQTDHVHAGDCAYTPTGSTQSRTAWGRWDKRAFDVDVKRCRDCGGRLKLVAAIEEPASQRRKRGHWLYSAPRRVEFAVSVVALLFRSDRIATL